MSRKTRHLEHIETFMNNHNLAILRNATTHRESSWDQTGRNNDAWNIAPGETKVLADLEGPGCITHLWLTQRNHYRECLLRFTWDNAKRPSVVCPLGDFFGLGHGIVNSYQSQLFTASTRMNNRFNEGCALNCYVAMPFRERARIELINESKEEHRQYFYVDYEKRAVSENEAYFHAEFRRQNPFGGWGHEITVNTPESNASNKERLAWENNYVIASAVGRGHYIGCNLSVTNLQGTWWGEGDDMIWVDGYKWPPELHGTGSEDYLNQAWGMQDNAFMRNGSSIYEHNTRGYQTSYVHHLENPIHFKREIKATIEHGHANHLANEMSSVAYWYGDVPRGVKSPPPVKKRMPIRRDIASGEWLIRTSEKNNSRAVRRTREMLSMKTAWKNRNKP